MKTSRVFTVVLVAAAIGVTVWLLRGTYGERAVSPRPTTNTERTRPRGNSAESEGGVAKTPDDPENIAVRTPPSGSVWAQLPPKLQDRGIRVVVAYPLKVRQYYGGDYATKRVWLVVGESSKERLPVPRGAHAFALKTDPDEPEFLLDELTGGPVRVQRRVRVTGRLVDAGGEPVVDLYLTARLGAPEDWNMRFTRAKDSWISATGDLRVDPFAQAEAITDENGRFTLNAVPGLNTLSYGENRARGTAPLNVVGDTDIGDCVVPPAPVPADRSATTRLAGVVLDAAGQRHPGATVKVWAGNVGAPFATCRADSSGAFSFTRLPIGPAMLWASAETRPYVVVPEQCSGRVTLPCGTSVILRATRPTEYAVLKAQFSGFCLFLRGDLLLSGGALTPGDLVRVPPGAYTIIAVRDPGIVRADVTVSAGDVLDLTSILFHTWTP